jgi:hypothetical protein
MSLHRGGVAGILINAAFAAYYDKTATARLGCPNLLLAWCIERLQDQCSTNLIRGGLATLLDVKTK